MLRLLAFTVVAGSLLAGGALAQQLELRLEGDLPFSAAELQAAVQLRSTTSAALHGHAVAVRGQGSLVTVELGQRSRTIELGDARGPDAARLVALLLADLALADEAEAAPPVEQPAAPPTEAAPVKSAPEPAPQRQPAAARTEPAEAPAWTRVALSPSVGKGVGALDPWTFALSLGVSQGLPPWLLSADIEWWVAPHVRRRGFESGWHAARLRLQAGMRLGVIELLVGPSLSPLWVSGGEGDHGVLFAVGATARVALRISRHLEGLIALGCDLFPHRVILEAYGASVIATPRIAPSIGVGVGWRSS